MGSYSIDFLDCEHNFNTAWVRKIIPTPSQLKLNIQPGLFKDGVSRVSGNNTCRNRETTLRGWALPNFMASFSLTHKLTAILKQNLP